MDRKKPIRLSVLPQAEPAPSNSPALSHPHACANVPYPLLVPFAFSFLEGRQSILG